MTTDDAALDDLVRDLGLVWPAGPHEWEDRIQAMLEPEDYAQYLEARMGFGSGPSGPACHDLSGDRPPLALLLQEGRLGYHRAVLPRFAEAVAAGRHGSIADLGCGCGFGTLYLAKRFPGARVVGIERSPGLAGLAEALKGRAGIANAEFVCGDYATGEAFGGPFDVAVTMHAMPTFLLTFLPSERPESYRRGKALQVLAAATMLPHRRVRHRLAAVRGLLAPEGRAVVNERMGDASRVLLFSHLANTVGLGLGGVGLIAWESPIETPGRHVAPLAVFHALAAPAPFDEDRVLGLLHPPPAALPDLSGLVPGRITACSGPFAAHAFHGLGFGDRPPALRAAWRDGRRSHLRLGASNGTAFAYCCDTHDGRDLKLAAAATAGQLFHSATEPFLRAANVGDLASLDPPGEQVPELFRSLLGG